MPTNTYDLITSYSLGSNTSAINFTSIPQTYTHLLIKLSSRDGSYGSINSSMYMRFNGDTTQANYNPVAYGYGTSAGGTTGGAVNSQPAIFLGQMPGPGYAAGIWASSYTVIPNYRNSLAKRSISYGHNLDNGSATPWITMTAGYWVGTGAITSISLISDGNYASGTFAQLYGISD